MGMRRVVACVCRALAGFAALTTLVAAPSVAEPAQPPEILAEYPPGTFLENLLPLPDGSLLVTSYLARRVERLPPHGPATTWAMLDAHPVSLAAIDDGLLVAVHGAPFTSGPEFTRTQAFVVLDGSGGEVRRFSAPVALFLNGMLAMDGNIVLVADSIAGTIWRVDAGAGTVTPWLQHPDLAQLPAQTEFRPGANGIKRRGDQLLISNSSRGALYAVKLDAAGAPADAPILVAATGPIDDFWVLQGGDIAFATHGSQAKRLGADGNMTVLLEHGCDGCTAIAAVPGPALIILTTGSLLEGGTAPARILRLPLPQE